MKPARQMGRLMIPSYTFGSQYLSENPRLAEIQDTSNEFMLCIQDIARLEQDLLRSAQQEEKEKQFLKDDLP